MSMTDKDKAIFNEILARFEKWQKDSKFSLETRIENLEKLTFFGLLNDCGEQGITNELRELIKRVGLHDLLEYALNPSRR